METETLVGRIRVSGSSYEKLTLMGLSIRRMLGGFLIGGFDRVEEVPTWHGNGTWKFFWKGEACFCWNPGTDVFAACTEEFFIKTCEKIGAQRAYQQSLREGPLEWEMKPTPFLEGWWLDTPDESLLMCRDTGTFAGFCTSETCAHNSHDPYGPVRRLYPHGGANSLFYLGSLCIDYQDQVYEHYYVLSNKDYVPGSPENKLYYLRITDPLHYGQSAQIVPQEEVPNRFPKDEDDLEVVNAPADEKPLEREARPAGERPPRAKRPDGPLSRSHRDRPTGPRPQRRPDL